GFDCEFDMGSTLAVPGCAINESRSDEQILNVARGRLPLVSLVSNTQNQFIEHFLRAVPDWDLLAILGPIRTFVWEIRFKTIVESESPKATLEFWMLPDGRGAGEISMRVPTDQALAERERLVEYLRNLGITKIALDESKTAWAMRYFASKLKPAE
ncbi:MAG TPA: hypothetical protein PLH57_10025, partial [Oligoflexia bacterium]|nr:hypothetical protein [Oligoflexia bacterium]